RRQNFDRRDGFKCLPQFIYALDRLERGRVTGPSVGMALLYQPQIGFPRMFDRLTPHQLQGDCLRQSAPNSEQTDRARFLHLTRVLDLASADPHIDKAGVAMRPLHAQLEEQVAGADAHQQRDVRVINRRRVKAHNLNRFLGQPFVHRGPFEVWSAISVKAAASAGAVCAGNEWSPATPCSVTNNRVPRSSRRMVPIDPSVSGATISNTGTSSDFTISSRCGSLNSWAHP